MQRSFLISLITNFYKGMDERLEQARIDYRFEEFSRRAVFMALLLTVLASSLAFMLMDKMEISLWWLVIIVPGLFLMMFFYAMHGPDARIMKIKRAIDGEIVSVLRFIILQTKSGRPLYDTLVDISNNFDVIGIYTDEIVNDIRLGTTMEDALNNAVERMPSENLRIVIWQMLNHVQTGSDVIDALNITMLNIIEEQKIEFKEYGKQLNVIALMYMIMAIILPTIGVSMIATFMVFVGIAINTGIVVIMWLFFTVLQFMFLMMIISKRPAAES